MTAKKKGRPSSLDSAAVTKLEMAFKLGASVDEACNFAEVTRQSICRYCKKHPEFRDKIHLWRTTPVFEAKRRVFTEITQNRNADMAMDLLRLEEKKKTRQEYARRWRAEDGEGGQTCIDKTPSGFMTQFLTELNGEDSGDEQQNT